MAEVSHKSSHTQQSNTIVQEKLKWLMLFRVAVAIILLATGIVVQFRESGSIMNESTSAFFAIAGLFFFLSILYIPLIRHIKKPSNVAASQTFVDIIIITFVIYISGGASSPLSFLYLLTIVGSTIVSYRSGGFWTASLSSVFYGALVNLEYYRIFPSMEEMVSGSPQFLPENTLYITASNIGAFFLVAFLSGYLAIQTKKIEAELLEKKIDYDALKSLNNDIVKNISIGLMTINSEGIITSFNSAAEQITGYSLEGIYGQKAASFLSSFGLDLKLDDKELVPNRQWEGWCRSREGNNYYLSFFTSPLKKVDGSIAGTIVFFQDMTALKLMEKELLKADRLAAVGRFAASVAHEIRNPLASISGSIELLRKNLHEATTSTNVKLMDIVLREIERLNKLITEFLIYAKPPRPQKRMFDVNAVIDETIALFNNAATEQNEVDIVFARGDIPNVPIDSAQIKQVLWNLMTNAVEAMGNKGIIRVESITSSIKGDLRGILLNVSDSGCGIQQEDLERIFDPFYTSKEKGSGLGLSVAHGIIEAHGGKIEVKSALGNGTTFSIFLPL